MGFEQRINVVSVTISMIVHLAILILILSIPYNGPSHVSEQNTEVVLEYELIVKTGGGIPGGGGKNGGEIVNAAGVTVWKQKHKTEDVETRRDEQEKSVRKPVSDEEGKAPQVIRRNSRKEIVQESPQEPVELPDIEELLGEKADKTARAEEVDLKNDFVPRRQSYARQAEVEVGDAARGRGNDNSKQEPKIGGGTSAGVGTGKGNVSGTEAGYGSGRGRGSGDGEGEQMSPCPQNMVQIPMGADFYCIDQYEYPNRYNVAPMNSVTAEMAGETCENAGKRLCSLTEWRTACTGIESRRYPYGDRYNNEKCNTESTRVVLAGEHPLCVSDYHVYDMSGNLSEWVAGSVGPLLVGGSFMGFNSDSTCNTQVEEACDRGLLQAGFRCCL